MSITKIHKKLLENSDPKRAVNFRKFFKNCGDDIFLGVQTATIRNIAKEFHATTLDDVLKLMQSTVHDERSLAHAIIRYQFTKADESTQKKIFRFYIKNRKYIKDWDGVDDSAPYIAGPYLFNRDKKILYKLARSKHIWDRRIAIVTTLYFIRHGDLTHTLNLAEMLLSEKEDLVQKAAGWALREVGKKNVDSLKQFLNQHHTIMPRTTLRYAIEKFPPNERKKYLLK